MKVVVWPSLVGMSICWSIMAALKGGLLRRFGVFDFARVLNTMTRKLLHDKPRLGLNGTGWIAIL